MADSKIIEACEREIRYRADYMMLDYDPDDIKHVEEPDGHIVVALWDLYLPQVEELAEGEAREKTPNIYITWSNRWVERGDRPWELRITSPYVHVRYPQLVMLIFPDGQISRTAGPFIRERIVEGEMAGLDLILGSINAQP